jgi:hypothetical protein
MDFMHRGDSKEASMGGIVVAGMTLFGSAVRMVKRIASFIPVNVSPAYRLDFIILSAGEGTYTLRETGKE